MVVWGFVLIKSRHNSNIKPKQFLLSTVEMGLWRSNIGHHVPPLVYKMYGKKAREK